MFQNKSEEAIKQCQKKYADYCYSISFAILQNREDAEECVNDTFLQAWAQGLPTISTVDPNGIIQKHQIGIVIQSMDDLKKAFNQLINDTDLYQKCKQNVIYYFQDNHSAQTSYEKLSQYIGK